MFWMLLFQGVPAAHVCANTHTCSHEPCMPLFTKLCSMLGGSLQPRREDMWGLQSGKAGPGDSPRVWAACTHAAWRLQQCGYTVCAELHLTPHPRASCLLPCCLCRPTHRCSPSSCCCPCCPLSLTSCVLTPCLDRTAARACGQASISCLTPCVWALNPSASSAWSSSSTSSGSRAAGELVGGGAPPLLCSSRHTMPHAHAAVTGAPAGAGAAAPRK